VRTLSLCMIVRDERPNLARSLATLLPYVSEAVVVDTGSRDGTPELAASLGARVFVIPWQEDFSLARNYSLEQARSDWLMWLDADNRVPPEDAAMLLPLVQRPGDAVLWATEIVEPGGGRLLQKRLFPRRPDIFFRYRVHEQLCHPPGLAQEVTRVRIYHWGYADPRRRRDKARRNLTLLLKELAERPEDFYVHYQLGRQYYQTGEPAQALKHMEMAAAGPAARENREIYRHARLLAALCRDRLLGLGAARLDLERLAGDCPDYGLVWYHLGLNHFRSREFKEAGESLARFLERGAGHLFLDLPEEKLRLTALLTRAQALRRQGDLAAAEQMLRLAQARYPREAAVWLETAALARGRSDAAEARRAVDLCRRLRQK